jgi:hypothetical protein
LHAILQFGRDPVEDGHAIRPGPGTTGRVEQVARAIEIMHLSRFVDVPGEGDHAGHRPAVAVRGLQLRRLGAVEEQPHLGGQFAAVPVRVHAVGLEVIEAGAAFERDDLDHPAVGRDGESGRAVAVGLNPAQGD